MGFTGTALNVRGNWGWDGSLTSRNWPDIVWPIAKGWELFSWRWISFVVVLQIRYALQYVALCHYKLLNDDGLTQ